MIDVEFRPVQSCAISQHFNVGELPPGGILQAFQHFPLQHESFAGTYLQDEQIQACAVINFADTRFIYSSTGTLERVVNLGICRNDLMLCHEYSPIG